MLFPGNACRIWVAFLPLCLLLTPASPAADGMNAVMLSDQQVSGDELSELKSRGKVTAVVLQLNGLTDEQKVQELEAAICIRDSGLALYYWIEIAHCPELADAHPEWMASLQGHPEWRRLFKDAPVAESDKEVIKNYPWVPVLYREAFDAHLARVRRFLDGKPAPIGLFLNDLQGAPSACGCGHPLCRWTADYGPIKTATLATTDAAALFVSAVAKLAPESEIIPVWATECEEHDGEKDGLCAGVGCYNGICWKAWTKQLVPLVATSERVGVLLPFRMFDRDDLRYGKTAGWVQQAVKMFQVMPLQNEGKPIESERLIAVLQGWDVSDADVDAQQRQAALAGVGGIVLVRTKIDQSWKPQLYKLP